MTQTNQNFTQEEITRVLETISTRKQVNWALLKETLNSPSKATEMLNFLQQQGFAVNNNINIDKIEQYLGTVVASDERSKDIPSPQKVNDKKTKMSSIEIKALILAVCITVVIGIFSALFVFKNAFFRSAISSHHNTIAKIFLKLGADINSCSPLDKENALLRTTAMQEKSIVQTLLDLGADTEASCDTGYTPLMVSAKEGDTEMLGILLKAGANPNAKIGSNSPVNLAAKRLDVGILSLLVNNGAEVKDGNALMHALEHPSNPDNTQLLDTVDFLIKHKANVVCVQNLPLLTAIRNKHLKVAEALIKAGADVNANEKAFKEFGARSLDSSIATPLWVAIQYKNTDIAKVLLKNGAHINIIFPSTYSQKWTYLMEAAHQNDANMITLLAQKGEKLNFKNSSNRTAFCEAIQYSRFESAIALLKNNAKSSCSYYDSDERVWIEAINPLMEATKGGSLELVRLLLKRGEGVNQRDYNERTPLMFASKNGNIDMVKLLLNNGANAKLTDEEDYNALDYAQKNNHADIAELLTKRGIRTQAVRQKASREEFEKYKNEMYLCREAYSILQDPYAYPREFFLSNQKIFSEHNCARLFAEYEKTLAEVRLNDLRMKGWISQ